MQTGWKLKYYISPSGAIPVQLFIEQLSLKVQAKITRCQESDRDATLGITDCRRG